MEYALYWAGWQDVSPGKGPTCPGIGGSYSEIEHVLGNREARALVRSCSLDGDPGTATHAVTALTLTDGPLNKGLGPKAAVGA